MKKTWLRITFIVLAVLLLLLACPVIRTAYRYHIVSKFLSDPEMRQRMSVVPKHRSWSDTPERIQNIDLGYATFDIGATGVVSRASSGHHKTCVMISNATVHVAFMQPFVPDVVDGAAMFPEAAKFPQLLAQLQARVSDPIQSAIIPERRQIASLSELAWMTRAQFMLYVCDLIEKAVCRIGRSEVISYETPYSKGLIRIGESPTDHSQGFIMISSPDTKCYVGCHVIATKASRQDIGVVAESIARSFRFSVETIPPRDEIALLIKKAGIQELILPERVPKKKRPDTGQGSQGK